MRLATEYQQQKKLYQKVDQGRKYIVRLGKGLPQQPSRKRGISLSKANSHIQGQSLGKNQISREKQREKCLLNQKQSPLQNRIFQEKQKVISIAAYGNAPRKINSYAEQHLVSVKHLDLERVASNTKYLSGVKSQQSLVRFKNSQNLITDKNVRCNNRKIENGPFISSKFIPRIQIRAISKQSKNYVETNPKFALHPSNLQVYQAKTQEYSPIAKSNPSTIQPKITFTTGAIITVDQARSKQKHIVNSKKLQETTTTRNTQKQISSQHNKNDPYDLSNLVMTRKNEETNRENSRLGQTKKYLKGVAESGEVSNSSSLSRISKGADLFSRAEFISLWDANKVESIISMRQSQQIKVEQSIIMHDYFNPGDFLLKKQ